MVMDSINAGLEKRDWTSSRQRMTPELVIRDSTRAASQSGSAD
jgi:hypothetical protein